MVLDVAAAVGEGAKMSTQSGADDARKRLVQRVIELLPEVVDRGNIDALDEVLAPDLQVRGTTGEHQNLAAFKAAVEQQSRSMDESDITIQHIIAEGNQVTVTFTHGLKFTSDFAGLRSAGKRARFTGTAHFRIAGDKVAEMWIHEDIPAMMAQVSQR